MLDVRLQGDTACSTLGTKWVFTTSSSLIPVSLHLNSPRNNPCALYPVKSGGWNWVTERLCLLKCQGTGSSVNLYHSLVPCRGPRLLGQGLSLWPHLSAGAPPTAEPQPRIQAKEPYVVPSGCYLHRPAWLISTSWDLD